MPARTPPPRYDDVAAEALSRAYVAMRRAKHDPDARLALAQALMQTDRRDLVRRHAGRAAGLAPVDWAGAPALGDLYFKLGEFDAAYAILRTSVAQHTADANALHNLSALFYESGDKTGAQKCLAAAARLEPIVHPRQIDPGKPTILRLRSAERSHYRISYDRAQDIYRRRLTGGHFSTKNFVDESHANLYFGYVFGDNLMCASELPAFDLAINLVSCADLSSSALRRIDRFLERFPDRPVINAPREVLLTTRARNFLRLGSIDGVRFPRTEMFCNDAPAARVADRVEGRGFAYPLIVREPGTHTGTSMTRLDSRSALVAHLEAETRDADFYAIEFLDCRDAQGLYHKTRAFFIDGALYPVANLTSDTWQIHSADRYRVMADHAAPQRAEQHYLRDPESYLGTDIFRRLHDIKRVIGLDFFGIDYTVDAEGKLVVFEANAAMRHNFDHVVAFPYTRPHLERISKAFWQMVQDRLAGGGSAREGSAPRSC